MLTWFVVMGSSQSAELHGSQHIFLQGWPQDKTEAHGSLHRAWLGSVEQANFTWWPHSEIVFVTSCLDWKFRSLWLIKNWGYLTKVKLTGRKYHNLRDSIQWKLYGHRVRFASIWYSRGRSLRSISCRICAPFCSNISIFRIASYIRNFRDLHPIWRGNSWCKYVHNRDECRKVEYNVLQLDSARNR